MKTTDREGVFESAHYSAVEKQGDDLRPLGIQQELSVATAEACFNAARTIEPTSPLGVSEGKRGGENVVES